MPDVPDPDFVGTLCEIWFAINYAAYHLAYVRVYLQTEALQTHGNEIRQAEQAYKDMTQSVSERELSFGDDAGFGAYGAQRLSCSPDSSNHHL